MPSSFSPLASASSSSAALSAVLMSRLPPLSAGWHRLYWLRHGETDWNRQGRLQGGGYDLPLNEVGQWQARQAAAALSQVPWTRVVSSPLQRAHETARMLVSASPPTSSAGAHVQTEADWGEMRFGDWEGTVIHGPSVAADVIDRYRAHGQAMQQHLQLPWPGGESILQVQQRGLSALDRLFRDNLLPTSSSTTKLQQQQHHHLGLVAHGRFNRILLAQLLSLPVEDVHQDNAGINVLDIRLHLEGDQMDPVVHQDEDNNNNNNSILFSSPSSIQHHGTAILWRIQARLINFVDHLAGDEFRRAD